MTDIETPDLAYKWTGDLVQPMAEASLVDTDAPVVSTITPADAEPILTEVSLY